MPIQENPTRYETLPLFHDLNEKDREMLLKAGKLRRLSKGDVLFMHGDPLSCFYIVIDGAIRQLRETPDGRETTVGLSVRGDIVGGSHLFESFKSYQWSAVAVEESLALEYPIAWFKEKVKNHGALALNMLTALSQDSHRAAIDAEQLITLSAAQRVACFMMRLCDLYQFDHTQFELPYSKSTIASKLGMEIETFSRTLKKLQDVGVTVSGTNVSIIDMHRLECFVCSHCSVSDDCATLDSVRSHCGSQKTVLGKIQ